MKRLTRLELGVREAARPVNGAAAGGRSRCLSPAAGSRGWAVPARCPLKLLPSGPRGHHLVTSSPPASRALGSLPAPAPQAPWLPPAVRVISEMQANPAASPRPPPAWPTAALSARPVWSCPLPADRPAPSWSCALGLREHPPSLAPRPTHHQVVAVRASGAPVAVHFSAWAPPVQAAVTPSPLSPTSLPPTAAAQATPA